VKRAFLPWLPVLALVVLCAGSLRCADTASTPASSPDEQFRRLEQDYQSALRKFGEAYRGAKTDGERGKVFQQMHAQTSTFAPRMLALARQFPQTPAAVKALAWLVTRGQPKEADLEEALKTLDADALNNDELVPVCAALEYRRAPESDVLLQDALDKSSNPKVRAAACLAIARRLKLQPGGDQAKAEKLFERAAAEFGDVNLYGRRTVRETAANELFEIRNLAIGKTAPEIEGSDVDGNRFKLSDYRGKVVVLDFWGYW
jgi:AhpC/TSA family